MDTWGVWGNGVGSDTHGDAEMSLYKVWFLVLGHSFFFFAGDLFGKAGVVGSSFLFFFFSVNT